MPLPFDTDAENAKLAHFREQEEEDLVQILAEKQSLGYADLSSYSVEPEALRLVPEARAREAGAVPFHKEGHYVDIGILHPENPAFKTLAETFKNQGFSLRLFLISNRSFTHALERYQELSQATQSDRGSIAVGDARFEELTKKVRGIDSVRQLLEEAGTKGNALSVSALLDTIIALASLLRASDIHLEPEEAVARLRFRLDGVLTDIVSFPEKTYRLLESRVKLLSGLKLNVENRAQDGRFSVRVGSKEIEIRTSAIPSNYGDSFVLRLLDPDAAAIGFEKLGIHPKLLARLEAEIRRPNGMLLTTGPTGSGKTTTLYAFLQKIRTPDIKIVTIEDPIEYHFDGIVQTQVDADNYTFASGLRSIVRQDPDVIMVGEIRDSETAGIAIQAALTGHFVYSTLHTNDAAGTFPRLVDLGVDPKEFGSALSVSMAQRLVRKLDPDARKEVPMTDAQKKLVDTVLGTITDQSLIPPHTDTLFVPDPHKEGDTGYLGRMGLYEAIFMDDALSAFLRENPSAGEIQKEAARQGFLTMAQDGILKALAGETSLEEVVAVADMPRI